MAAPALAPPGPPAPVPSVDLRRDRYITDILALHDRISFRLVAEQADPAGLLYQARRPGGLVVLAVLDSALPHRYRLGIAGFRLAQYLRLRYAVADVVYRRALFAEPGHGGARDELHLLALDGRTGAIVRYLSLLGSADPAGTGLRDPARSRFPCEIAHGVDLFAHVPAPAGADSQAVWEAKRLVNGPGTADTAVGDRLTLALELMRGFWSVLAGFRPAVRMLVGDGEEGVAINRLLRNLADVTVLEGTRPRLPAGDLMEGAYTEREVVKVFAAAVPHEDRLRDLVDRIDRALAGADVLAGFKELVAGVAGQVRKVTV